MASLLPSGGDEWHLGNMANANGWYCTLQPQTGRSRTSAFLYRGASGTV